MGGFFEKLNKPKSLLVVLALTLVVDSLLLYRYQSMMSPAIFEMPVLEESSAAKTEEVTAFAATVGQDWQEGHSGAENTRSEAQRPENKSPVVFLASARGPTTLAPAPSHTLYLPVLLYRPNLTTEVAPGSPPQATSKFTPLVVSPAASPTTERFASAFSPVPREEASEAATPEAVTPTAPASKPATTTDRESAPKEPVEAPKEPEEEAYPMATAPAPKDLVSAPLGQDAIVPRGGVPDDTIPTTAPQKSTKDGSTPLQPPPTRQPLPPPIPSAQAQCRDGGFVAFGFETQDDCISFLATQGKKEPSKQDQKK